MVTRVSGSYERNRDDRISRAYRSLQGLCCGDAFGNRFFIPEDLARSLIGQKALPAPVWAFTDDTMMAISIVSVLEENGEINQRELAMSFARYYDPERNYGPAMDGLLPRLRGGESNWREEALALFGGEGSFGNGSAMRVAPLGAYFADDLAMAAQQAELSAVTTHCHVEAIAGAIAVAVASALAWRRRFEPELTNAEEFLFQVYERTPESRVRRGLKEAIDLSSNSSVDSAVGRLGNGSRITAQDTVPFSLWSAASHLQDYEEALWATVGGLGDRDTTCAIVGGIVVLSAGLQSIPKPWLDCCEPIPREILPNFDSRIFGNCS